MLTFNLEEMATTNPKADSKRFFCFFDYINNDNEQEAPDMMQLFPEVLEES